MQNRPAKDVTLMLEAISQGETQAAQDLLPLVYNELRRLARRAMANERAGHTLQATGLVHEAFIRLVGGAEVEWKNRIHFFRAAAQAMRRILVDSARQKAAQRHGGGQIVSPVDPDAIAAEEPSDDLLTLDQCLDRLEQLDARKADVVKLRYFGGLSVDDTAAALGITTRTVRRDWVAAKAWLWQEMTGPDTSSKRSNPHGE